MAIFYFANTKLYCEKICYIKNIKKIIFKFKIYFKSLITEKTCLIFIF